MALGKLLVLLLLLLGLSGVQCAKKRGELKVDVLRSSEGCSSGRATVGDKVTAHYTGTLVATGQVFDSSKVDGKEPFSFTLGKGQVIKGFDQGFDGMCVGEHRRLTIPPHLGYGERGYPPSIPGGATLRFDVELVALEKQSLFSRFDLSKLGSILFPAAIVGAIVYFIYQRAQEESATRKGSKGSIKKRR